MRALLNATRLTPSELWSQRIPRRRPEAVRATQMLVFPHGGMGDSVVFEVIVRDALGARPKVRVVVVLPPHGNDYDARSYTPGPHEVWMLASTELTPFDSLMRRVQADGIAAFSGDGPVETLFFGPPADDPPVAPGCRWIEPYAHLARLAERGVYPQYRVFEPSRALAARTLGGAPSTERPWVALHCRRGATDARKNPCPRDITAVARALRRDGARVLVVGANQAPEELLAVADARSDGEDRSLQSTAALLETCSLLIGGDSGPAHLAAAVGTPVLAILGADERFFGPFGARGLITHVVARRDASEGGLLRFDADRVTALARGILRVAAGGVDGDGERS